MALIAVLAASGPTVDPAAGSALPIELVVGTEALFAPAGTGLIGPSGDLRRTQGQSPPVLNVVVASGALAPARQAAGTCVAGPDWGFRRDDLAVQVARIVNRYRVRIGLRPLQLELGLMRSAIWKSQHMAHFFYFGHADPAPPVSRGVPQRLAACGFGAGGSENIAYGFETPREVVRAWLRSPGHRRNIRSSSWQYLGVGVAESHNGGFFWAQNFG